MQFQKTIELSQFTGSENFYRHWLGGLIYTDGVQYLAEQAQAFWLIDAIASHQPRARRDPMLRDFQIWFLRKNKTGNGARLECWRDTGEGQKAAIVQRIEFTDFPFDAVDSREVKLYVENGTLCLPSERWLLKWHHYQRERNVRNESTRATAGQL